MPTLAQSGRRRRSRIELPTELWVAIALACALIYAYSDFVADDALISLRYARHLAEGEGLRWNQGGEVVEGYSNFTHVMLGASCEAIGLPPLDVLRAINWLAVVGIVVLVHTHARRLGCGRVSAGGAAVLVALHPALAFWSNSGLETALFSFLVLLSLHLVVDADGDARPAPALVLLTLTRPEGAAIAALILPVLYLHRYLADAADRGHLRALWRTHGRWACWVASVCAGYFAWRTWYFGHPLPNSVYYKAEAIHAGELTREFLEHTLPVVLAALLFPLRSVAGRSARGALLIAIPSLYAVILYDAADSVAVLHRFFVPAFVCLVILAATTIESRVVHRWGPIAGIGAWLVLFGWIAHHPDAGHAATFARSHRLADRARVRVAVAEWIDREMGSRPTVALGDVGIVGYLLDNPIEDLFGLNDAAFVHEFDKHRVPYVKSVMTREPAVVALVSRDPDRFVERWVTDRRVLESAGFDERYHLAHRVQSLTEPYHYRIYVRGPQADHASTESRGSSSPAALIRRARAAISAH